MTFPPDNRWELEQAQSESQRKDMEWAVEYSLAQPDKRRRMANRRALGSLAAILLLLLFLGTLSVAGEGAFFALLVIVFGLMLLVLVIGVAIPSSAASLRQIWEGYRRHGFWYMGCSLLTMIVVGCLSLLILLPLLQHMFE